MTVDVVSAVTIERPLEIVAAFAAEPSNAPAWYVNIRSVESKTSPPLGVGSRFEFVARFLGRDLRYTYEVVELIPQVLIVMRTTEGPFPMETSYYWSARSDTETRMTLRNRGEPIGWSRFVAPFVELATRSANKKDLRRLKSILES